MLDKPERFTWLSRWLVTARRQISRLASRETKYVILASTPRQADAMTE